MKEFIQCELNGSIILFRLDTGAHFYDTYETKDGEHMAVGALEPQFYAELLEKLGLSEDDVPHFDEFEKGKETLTKIFKTKTQEDWCKIFDGSDACVTPVLTIDRVASHVHNRSLNSFVMGKDDLVVPKPTPRLSRTPGVSCSSQSPNISVGEHSVEILNDFKYTQKEITDFLENGVVEQAMKNAKL